MFQESFSGLDKDLHLHFERGHADVHLVGVDETYLRVQGEGESADYAAQWRDGTLTMNLDDDCIFYVPRKLNVRVSGQFDDVRVTELAGNLTLEGSMGDVVINAATGQVQVGAVPGNLKANELGALTVNAPISGDAHIVGVGGSVQLQDVMGDLQISDVGAVNVANSVSGSARINAVRGDVNVPNVMGDLVVSDAAALSAGAVNGDLRASDLTGNVNVGSVSGDAKLQGIAGNVSLSGVGGDARLVEISGSVSSVTAGGDLIIDTRFGFAPAGAYRFEAGGDLVLTLPANTAAKLVATAGGNVVSKIGGDKQVRARHGGVWQAEMGEGGPAVNLQAGGDVKIKTQGEGNVEFRKEIIEDEMQRAKEEVRRAKEELKRIKHELRDHSRRLHDEVQRDVHVNIEREVRHGLRGLRGLHRHFDVHMSEPPEPPVPPRPPKAPKPPQAPNFSFSFGFGKRRDQSAERPAPVSTPTPKQGPSDEERMTILKMLSEKRISAEQAETLLKALGEE
jgi:hypothetical protein